MTRHSFTDRVEAYFRQHPGRWIPAVELEAVGGRQAWRTRVSDVRQRGLDIENRCRWITRSDGTGYKLSEYRWVAPVGQLTLI